MWALCSSLSSLNFYCSSILILHGFVKEVLIISKKKRCQLKYPLPVFLRYDRPIKKRAIRCTVFQDSHRFHISSGFIVRTHVSCAIFWGLFLVQNSRKRSNKVCLRQRGGASRAIKLLENPWVYYLFRYDLIHNFTKSSCIFQLVVPFTLIVIPASIQCLGLLMPEQFSFG